MTTTIIIIILYLIVGRILSYAFTTKIADERERIPITLFYPIIMIVILINRAAKAVFLMFCHAYQINLFMHSERDEYNQKLGESYKDYIKRLYGLSKAVKKDYEEDNKEWDDVTWRPYQRH